MMIRRSGLGESFEGLDLNLFPILIETRGISLEEGSRVWFYS